jgi:hypothetical protein
MDFENGLLKNGWTLDQKVKMVRMLLAEDQKEKKEEVILNVYRSLKLDQCRKVKDDSAVQRKRAAGNTGPKPTNVSTFAKGKKMEKGW